MKKKGGPKAARVVKGVTDQGGRGVIHHVLSPISFDQDRLGNWALSAGEICVRDRSIVPKVVTTMLEFTIGISPDH